jgi:hypothetical protein
LRALAGRDLEFLVPDALAGEAIAENAAGVADELAAAVALAAELAVAAARRLGVSSGLMCLVKHCRFLLLARPS